MATKASPKKTYVVEETYADDLICRSCGVVTPLSDFRLFQTSPEQVHMDFCVHCEQKHGTTALYRRFNAYGTAEIVKAVFTAERTPDIRKTPEQVRLLVQSKSDRAPETNEEVIKRELQRRELARRRLIYFTTAFHPAYKPGWMHQDICRRLERFVQQIEAGASPRLMICMPPRSGKLVAHSTPTLTTEGWKPHGELCVGDMVYHPSGSPTKIVAVSPDDIASLEVVFSDGSVVKVHPNHEWTVYDRSRGAWRVVETSYLASQALHSGPKGTRGGRYRFQLPDIAAVVHPDAPLLMPPYALGAWLGDGTSARPWITHAAADTAVIEGVTACGYAPTQTYVHKTTGVHSTVFAGDREKSDEHRGAATGLFMRHIHSLGVRGNKHIPEPYFRASVSQRLQLMAGLIDTDGTVDKHGRVLFSSCMPRLANDVLRLARELGMRPYMHIAAPKTSSSGIVGKQDVYVVGFQPNQHIPTRLARKEIGRFAVRRRVSVTCVRPAPPELGKCIQVDMDDGMYMVGAQLTPTHNSALASDAFPSWVLGKHPEWPIIASSYAQSLPLEFSRNIRDRLTDPEYMSIFPNSRLRADAKGIEAWKTIAGGGYIAAGVGTGITGKGFMLGILDDPIKDQEAADSEQIRNATYKWYQSVFRTRVAPGGGILIINTRWHWHDPSGLLLDQDAELAKSGVPLEERENWEVVSYPAIAEADEYLMRDGTIGRDVPPEVQDQALRLLRKKGEALHPERYPINELKKLKNSLSASIWSALYQQQPTPDEGDFFKKDDFQFRWLDPAYRPLCTVFMTVDYAIGKKQRNDFTVAAVFALDAEDNLYVLEIRRGRWGTTEIADNVAALVERHKPDIYAGEQGSIHMAVWPVIKQALDARRLYITVDETLTPIQDKEARARPLQGRMQRHKLFFSYDEATRPEIYDITEREMLQFPNGVNDDIVDVLAWGSRLALNISLPNAQTPVQRQKGWKDKLVATTAARSSMAA